MANRLQGVRVPLALVLFAFVLPVQAAFLVGATRLLARETSAPDRRSGGSSLPVAV